jgi:hypothetical protein
MLFNSTNKGSNCVDRGCSLFVPPSIYTLGSVSVGLSLSVPLSRKHKHTQTRVDGYFEHHMRGPNAGLSSLTVVEFKDAVVAEFGVDLPETAVGTIEKRPPRHRLSLKSRNGLTSNA